jgi:hypothetical protein
MKEKLIVATALALLVFVMSSSMYSEIAWTTKERSTEPIRQIVGLPSIAIGNLNPATRNPGLEIWCTSFYDLPGGDCHYFTLGVPYVNQSIDPRARR